MKKLLTTGLIVVFFMAMSSSVFAYYYANNNATTYATSCEANGYVSMGGNSNSSVNLYCRVKARGSSTSLGGLAHVAVMKNNTIIDWHAPIISTGIGFAADNVWKSQSYSKSGYNMGKNYCYGGVAVTSALEMGLGAFCPIPLPHFIFPYPGKTFKVAW